MNALRTRIPSRAQGFGDQTGRWWSGLPWPLRLLAVLALFFALAILVPTHAVGQIMAPQSSWQTILFDPIGTYILLALGLNVVVGQAGMLDLGYVAFYAVGGYAMALLATKQHWDFWVVLPVGLVIAAAAGIILGAPTLRLRGDYLAIVTLGFGEIIATAANNWSWDGGPQGINSIPHPPNIDHIKAFTYGVLDAKPYYYLVLAAIFGVVFAMRRLEHSRVGRAWAAVREDEDAAELMGVPTYRFRLWAFSMGAAVGGISGVLFASHINHIDPTNFPYYLSVLIVAAVVLGGSGNIPGVILGAFLVAWLPERFRGFEKYRILIFGAALIVTMIFRPEGLLPSRQRRAEVTGGADD
jgi:branched-chain amino acid transport system permease protein